MLGATAITYPNVPKTLDCKTFDFFFKRNVQAVNFLSIDKMRSLTQCPTPNEQQQCKVTIDMKVGKRRKRIFVNISQEQAEKLLEMLEQNLYPNNQ